MKNSLIRGESIEYQTTYHWIIFINARALITLFIAPIFDKYCDEFAITNKRVIIKAGFITRKTIELNLSKIECVNVDQSLLGRIFGYGNIQIIGTGGTKETFVDIKNPLKFRKIFQEFS